MRAVTAPQLLVRYHQWSHETCWTLRSNYYLVSGPNRLFLHLYPEGPTVNTFTTVNLLC